MTTSAAKYSRLTVLASLGVVARLNGVLTKRFVVGDFFIQEDIAMALGDVGTAGVIGRAAFGDDLGSGHREDKNSGFGESRHRRNGEQQCSNFPHRGSILHEVVTDG